MTDRVVEHPNRYKLTAVSGAANTYDLEAVPGTVTAEGTAINKATLLSDTVAASLGLSGDPTVSQALDAIVQDPITVTFASASWTLNSTTNCYEQSVAVTGLLTTDDYRTSIGPVGNSSDPDAQALTDEAYGVVAAPGGRMACDTDGYLYARCPADASAPEVDFSVYIVIAR